MTVRTLRNISLDVQEVTTEGVSYVLNSNLSTLVLQARAGAIWLKLNDVADAEYWILTDGQPQSFSIPDLAGATIYFDAGSTLNVEILQILKDQA